VEASIQASIYAREIDIRLVKDRIKPLCLKIRKKDLHDVLKIVEFFTEKGYSLLDVLIRCSTEMTIMPGNRYHRGDLSDIFSLGLTRYSTLWQIMEKKGLSVKNS
jgi:hypothetical protein